MKFLQKVQEYASFIITVIVALILAMMMFVIVKGSDNWRDPQLWIEAGFNTMLQIVMIATWLPEGKKRGAQDANYATNQKTANEKMQSAAKAENFNRLTLYCKEMTQKNIDAWITKHVARFGVVYAQWSNEKYRKQFDIKIAQKVRKAELTAPRRVAEIKATEIVTNSEINLVYDTKDHTDSATRLKVMFKVVLSITMCAVGAFIQPEGVAFSIAAVYNFLYWLLLMCLSIFYSIRTGYKLIVVERNDYYKRIIIFLSNFEAWQPPDMRSEKQDNIDNAEDKE